MVSGIVCIYTIDTDTDTLPPDTSISLIWYRYRHIYYLQYIADEKDGTFNHN